MNKIGIGRVASRRQWLKAGVAGVGGWLSWVHACGAQVSDGTPTLKEQLEKGLKARFPNEFAFIQTVVTMVDNNQLPLDLVQSSFLWVRKNKADKKYMVPYFERILRARALAMGIVIP